jgi:5,10-methylenetetrahydromethanopterin reductase
VRIVVNLGGEAVARPRPPRDLVAEAVAAERDGLTEAWSVHFSRSSDSLAGLAAAAAVTSRIRLGVGVVPTYPRHPAALAQSALTLQSLSGGRFSLGVGVSHRPVIEDMHGLDYSHPLGHLREYLTVLTALLRTGEVSFVGERYRVQMSVAVPDATPVPVLVGALSHGTSRLAGELADGVVTWLAGPRALAEVVVPAVTSAAAAAGRPQPRVVAAVPVAVDPDAGRARRAAGEIFARYGALRNYRRLFEREGVDGAAELAAVGDAATVERRLRSLLDAGATDVWAVPFPTSADAGLTTELLRNLATT